MVVGGRDAFQIVGGVVPGFTKPMGKGGIGVKMTAPDGTGGNCHGGLPRARVTCELEGDVACTDKRSNRPDEREGELSSTGNCHPLNGVSRPNRRDCHDQAKSVATPSRSEEEQKIGKVVPRHPVDEFLELLVRKRKHSGSARPMLLSGPVAVENF
jgi:hypothetical protein